MDSIRAKTRLTPFIFLPQGGRELYDGNFNFSIQHLLLFVLAGCSHFSVVLFSVLGYSNVLQAEGVFKDPNQPSGSRLWCVLYPIEIWDGSLFFLLSCFSQKLFFPIEKTKNKWFSREAQQPPPPIFFERFDKSNFCLHVVCIFLVSNDVFFF